MKINTNQNCNCDGSHCTKDNGEVRLLPLSKADSSNIILCYNCYLHEIAWRKERNKTVHSPFPLPEWNDLEIYGTNLIPY